MRLIVLSLILTLFFLIPAVVPLTAQRITPPITEYSQIKVDDTFEIKNVSETSPLTVVALTAKTFTVDGKTGEPAFIDVDPSKISLKLSEQSAHIPPLGTHTFDIQARCLEPKQPCWFTIFASISVGRAANGVLVTVVLGHTVYLFQGHIPRKDIQVSFVDAHTIAVKNTGSGLDRPLIELHTTDGKKTFGVPIFPNGTRVVASESPITKAVLKFSHFKVDVKQ